MKGISPLVATVLLIALTVGIGGVIGFWLTGFTQTSTQIVAQQGQLQIICQNGAIDVVNLKYCNNNITGTVRNNGRIALGNITVQVIFNNASQVNLALNDSSGSYLALKPGVVFAFNQSIGSTNYNKIFISTNCSGVTTTADSTDVAAC